MEEDNLGQRPTDIDGEFEIDSEAANSDLESAMQEALEAVDKATESLNAREEEDDVGRAAAAASVSKIGESGEIEKLEEEVVELRNRSARTLADFDNFRKRVERERLVERRYAAFDVMGAILAVVDNLERALAAGGPADDLRTGVELIHRQMIEVMKNSGVTRIESSGEEFDPRFHEAVTHHEDPGVSVPTVSEELQSGYLMHDRLLRPAVVKVAMPPEEDTGASSNPSRSPGREG